MSTAIVSKPSSPSKWFSNKSFKLSLPRLRLSKSNVSSPRASSPSSPSSQTHELTKVPVTPKGCPSRKDQLQEVFRYFDSDGDGKISGYELRSYFASIGEYMSQEQAQGVINDLDTDGDNLMDFDDFVKLMERDHDQGGVDEDLRSAFEMFEVEKGCGCITPKGLQRMFSRLGDERSFQECEAMIQKFDLDGNGVLDFDEFNQMMA
ncbi:probable calcium-binding protein CML41 [Macadamia integrifolia]|uniref:probable calcium-binding protein CML41 n=1 Tax=Macadamia integrifolia TaxID=60698 RepID=UPI001C4FB62A|nr:probable calcium-binding protein CML41 [Macadamia integrifolia]